MVLGLVRGKDVEFRLLMLRLWLVEFGRLSRVIRASTMLGLASGLGLV